MLSYLSHFLIKTSGIQTKRYILPASVAFILSVLLFPSTAYAGGNSFITTELRVDLLAVKSARNYKVSIMVGGIPTTGATANFTTGWLGIHTPDFLQVGFMTKTTGVRWFVEEFSANASIQCFHGTYLTVGSGGEACYGNFNDRATIGYYQTVELVTYNQGFWIARVYDRFGNALDVAKLNVSTPTNYISKASVVMEEAYIEASDPYMLASFWFNHPKYIVWGTGPGTGFQDWPASPSGGARGSNNKLTSYPSGVCPNHYIARLNWFGNDPRIWYTGSAGPMPATCAANPVW